MVVLKSILNMYVKKLVIHVLKVHVIIVQMINKMKETINKINNYVKIQ